MWRLSPHIHIKTAIVTKSQQATKRVARTITTKYQPIEWKGNLINLHQTFTRVVSSQNNIFRNQLQNNLQLSFPFVSQNNSFLFNRRFSTVPTENPANKSQTQEPTSQAAESNATQSGQPLGNIFHTQNQENSNNTNNNTNNSDNTNNTGTDPQTTRTIVSTTGPLEVAVKVTVWDHVRNVLSAVIWIIILYAVFFSKETPFSSFTASPAKEAVSEKTKLKDVKGNDEAKQELEDVIVYLKEAQRFALWGVKPPKGLLFIGPPGCGKTLLAKALAGEAGVPFYYTSGAEFEEMFVGVGAGRVRKLFQKARNGQGAIIFIDEIDAIGSRFDRDANGKAGKMTLNQLLVEMDGFKPNDKVVVIAATNAPQVLDPALVRPGRFDRTVSVELPHLDARKEIIEMYLGDKAAPDVDVDKLARSTTGYSGADLFSMVNGAGIRAVKARLPFIPMSLLEQAKEDVALGPEKKSKPITPEEKRLTAFHESGHALVALYGSKDHEIDKATLVPRSKALGYVRFNESEKLLHTKESLKNEIAISMGGRAAEEIIFGANRVSPGASSDFEKATSLAERMVLKFGMSDKVGNRSFDKEQLHLAAEQTKIMIDGEIKSILDEEYNRAKTILVNHRQQLQRLAENLMEYEELSLEEIKLAINGGDIKSLKQQRDEERKKRQQELEQAIEQEQALKLKQLQEAAAKHEANKKSKTNNFVAEILSNLSKVANLEW